MTYDPNETAAEQPAEENPDVERRMVTREIRVDLTDEELSRLAKEAGKLHAEIVELDDEFSKVKKTHDNAVKAKQEKIDSILRVAHNGRDSQVLDCEEVRDYRTATVQYFHDGRMVEERAMEADELQRSLPIQQVEQIAEHLEAEDDKTVREQVAEDIQEQTNLRTASAVGNC